MLGLVIEEIKELAKQKNEDIIIDKTGDEMSFILANKKKGFVGVLSSGQLIEGGNPVINAYSIDIGRWHWAREEGFNKEQIATELRRQIFKQISFDDMMKELM